MSKKGSNAYSRLKFFEGALPILEIGWYKDWGRLGCDVEFDVEKGEYIVLVEEGRKDYRDYYRGDPEGLARVLKELGFSKEVIRSVIAVAEFVWWWKNVGAKMDMVYLDLRTGKGYKNVEPEEKDDEL